ncbi:MAG: hypothetical protein ACWGQW_11925, partial [bacterium]
MRRLAWLVTVVMLVCCGMFWSVEVKGDCTGDPCSAFFRGDTDADGDVDYYDALNVADCANYDNCGDGGPEDSYDVNDDGDVTAADAAYMFAWYFQSPEQSPAPPAPWTAEGWDPTPDTQRLECDYAPGSYNGGIKIWYENGSGSTGALSPYPAFSTCQYYESSATGSIGYYIEWLIEKMTDTTPSCSLRASYIDLPTFMM